MKRLAIAVVSIALCGCGQKPPAQHEAAQGPKEKAESGLLTLDDTAQRKAHLVAAVVQAKDVAQSLTAPGKLAVNDDQTWRVGAVAGGKIHELTARVGDFVHAGQIVGRIHSHDVHEARAAYQQASTEFERARSAEAYASRRRDRAQRLFALKAGSRQEVESAEAEVRNAQAAIEKAKIEIARERAHLTDILHIPVEDRANTADGEDGVPIFAPASGVILERKATAGSVVNAGDELLTISNIRSLWMIAAANEADLGKLRPGQTVRIEVRAYPGREFTGRILKLGEQLDPGTRTLQLRILVPNPQGLLKPEMYAIAGIEEGSRRAVLVLPEEAIQDINGVPAVFVRRSATEFEPRTVKTGRHANGEVEIAEGLKSGESVVVKGTFLLKSQLLRRSIEE
ncbi:MAG TPA: efflux RND transporter periplasmic adaptor subunit [Bryobacteraceae bacterium]|nr:efflux RND transporter periplasmic adaptor subunit [Bryobacteraceae bacterium]